MNRSGYAYFTAGGRGGEMLLHRFLIGGPIPKGMVVDHINRNRRDCRISNLRVVTPAENAANTDHPRVVAASGQTGVYPTKDGRWHVRISVEGAAQSYGIYSDLAQAKRKARQVIAEREARFSRHDQRRAA